MKVKALFGYNDKELKRFVKKGEVLEVTKKRAMVLLKGNPSSKGKPFVEVVEEEVEVATEEVVEEVKEK